MTENFLELCICGTVIEKRVFSRLPVTLCHHSLPFWQQSGIAEPIECCLKSDY